MTTTGLDDERRLEQIERQIHRKHYEREDKFWLEWLAEMEAWERKNDR
jgi:hypothetical protein